MSYWAFTNIITSAMLIAIFAAPMPYANDIAIGSGALLVGMVIGREFGKRMR